MSIASLMVDAAIATGIVGGIGWVVDRNLRWPRLLLKVSAGLAAAFVAAILVATS